jgi:alkanesulfonate monooxygenase SsuD/methylene tetrahydromethanopterin reductase-like flavin-dependent oxidoreductase (luciferase family)
VHFGAVLPNYGLDSTIDEIRRRAELAEELGFDSVWTTEHIIVGHEAVDPYGRVYDPLITLGWIAGWTDRIGLSTSIVLVPLHHPIHLAKEAATLQELSGGRFALGVGVGWHRDEYDFMGIPFDGRGRRADEAIRLMRSLWRGDKDFDGESGRSTTRPRSRTPHRSRRSGSAAARSAAFGERSSWATCGIRRVVRTRSTCDR